jgi:predicted PolB exonuclease-like 3'-5' exonuclease
MLAMVYAIFDIETRIDKGLLNQTFFSGLGLDDNEAFRRFAAEKNSFVPTSLHVPISIALGTVDADYALTSVASLALDHYSEERIVREFWAWIEQFPGTLVSFNGRRFDLPVLELAALRVGISAPAYFSRPDSPRRGDAAARHLDLFDFLSNRGAVNLRGGLNLLLKMMGLPGKREISGANVQEMFEAGRLDEIHRYCCTDVIQTYLLFLRVELMRGRVTREVSEAHWSAALTRLRDFERPSAG